MKDLYVDFVDRGEQSPEEALQVGIDIEEMDIEDLIEAIATKGMPRDVIRVFNNLLSGSNNHLDAFIAAYDRETLQ